MKEQKLWPFCLSVLVAIAGVVLIVWSIKDAINKANQITEEGDGEMCAQVITPAKNPETGEIVEYPTPCDVPEGWEVVQPNVVD